MPNHVSTILKLSGDSKQIKKFIADIKVEGKEEYDFDLLLPVPKELEGTCAPSRIVSEDDYRAFLDEVAQKKVAFERGEITKHQLDFAAAAAPITQAMSDDLKKRFGFDNWYSWRLNNYGTKWGMYDVEFDGVDSFSYNTAWSPATEYFLTISEKFPKVNFTHEFADEGGGFLGYETIKNGKVIETCEYDWSSDKGIELRQKLGCYYDGEEEEEEEDA